jgi:hypothetical protein
VRRADAAQLAARPNALGDKLLIGQRARPQRI